MLTYYDSDDIAALLDERHEECGGDDDGHTCFIDFVTRTQSHCVLCARQGRCECERCE